MKKVLVIEDEQLVLENILELLEVEGFNAIGASSGYLGLQLAKEEHPDVILCDIMIPEVDGYVVLSSLRQDPDTAQIPLIFVTAKAHREERRYGLKIGANGYLTKPFTVDELLSLIHKVAP